MSGSILSPVTGYWNGTGRATLRCVEQKDVVADDIGLKSFGRRERKLRLPKKKKKKKL